MTKFSSNRPVKSTLTDGQSFVTLALRVEHHIRSTIPVITTFGVKSLLTNDLPLSQNIIKIKQENDKTMKIYEAYSLHKSKFKLMHTCLLSSVDKPSATALLQHGIPFLPPSKIVRPYIVSITT